MGTSVPIGGAVNFLGADVAPNHTGFVMLDEEYNLVDIRYTCKTITSHKKAATKSWRTPPKKKGMDSQLYEMERVAFTEDVFCEVLRDLRPDYVAIEGLAYGESGSETIAEYTMMLKLLLWRAGVPFRIHDPTALKLFVTHDAHAKKEFVRQDTVQRWGVEFSRYNASDVNISTEEDLCDAYALARLLVTEYRIRNGLMRTSDLEHPQEVRVFNRTTKKMPTNLLDRSWTAQEQP